MPDSHRRDTNRTWEREASFVEFIRTMCPRPTVPPSQMHDRPDSIRHLLRIHSIYKNPGVTKHIRQHPRNRHESNRSAWQPGFLCGTYRNDTTSDGDGDLDEKRNISARVRPLGYPNADNVTQNQVRTMNDRRQNGSPLGDVNLCLSKHASLFDLKPASRLRLRIYTFPVHVELWKLFF